MSSSANSALEINSYNKKEFMNLADNVFSVPRPPIIKVLFAAYLFVYPYKENFDAIIESEDINQMKKIIKSEFNSKAVSEDTGLITKMREFENAPFGEIKPNYVQIAKLLRGADM